MAKGVTFVNHTFTSHLALSASLQPYAGLADHRIAEFPFAPRQLALDITSNHIMPDKDGLIRLPEAPGLGMNVNTAGAEALSARCRDRRCRDDPVPQRALPVGGMDARSQADHGNA